MASQPKVSVRGVARAATRDDARAREQVTKVLHGSHLAGSSKTVDSFVNFAHKMGVGADNPLSYASYGYNPVTRNRNLMEWIHRGSWLGGQAIDVVADDMTRAGIDYVSDMDPEQSQCLDEAATRMGLWNGLNEGIKWGRLYGGSITVMLIDGQDLRTPLREETVGPEAFKGMAVFDRWMVEPSLNDLVTEFGPQMGKPKFYTVSDAAPALRGSVIHYSRIVLRHVGVELPYQQSLTENLWGASVLERLYDRMIGFDSATTGISQLVYKAYLRTLKIKDLRTVVASGGAAMQGLTQYAEMMRRYQNIEGLTLIDGEDELEVQTHGAFSGLGDALTQLGQQLSGALQIPLVRLFGQSPAGLNSTGESDLRNYYDGINQRQNKDMKVGVTTMYRVLARSEGVKVGDDFEVDFSSLWQLEAKEKADIAKTGAEAISAAKEAGFFGAHTGLKELRQLSRITGIFTNITREMIDNADDEVLPPDAEQAADHEHEENLLDKTHQHEAEMSEADREHAAQQAEEDRKHQEDLTKTQQKHQANLQSSQDKVKERLTDKQLKSKERSDASKSKQVAGRPRGRAKL